MRKQFRTRLFCCPKKGATINSIVSICPSPFAGDSQHQADGSPALLFGGKIAPTIQFEKSLVMPDQGSRPVYYASKSELEAAIIAKYPLIRMEPVQSPVNKNLKMQQRQQKTANLKTKT